MMMSPVGVVPSPRVCRGGCDDDDVPVGKNGEVVVRSYHGDIAFGAGGRCERGVQLCRCHLPDYIVA